MSLDKRLLGSQFATYLLVFCGVWLCLTIYPPEGGYIWEEGIINVSSSILFTLLVGLTAHLAQTDRSILGLICTALFLMLFCPGAERFFVRDESALLELSSQCIVPFFIGQYMRVRRKDFKLWYFLMLLMGIFCSYTHNGITIPLCLTFVWLSFLHRKMFFRRACWPMVVGFVIGTGISIYNNYDNSLTLNSDIETMASSTTLTFSTLWDTKVFVVALVLAGYMSLTHRRRHIMIMIGRRNYVITGCLIASLIVVPFAPLGIGNAVTGVCFFSMFYIILVTKHLAQRYLHWRL